MVDKKTLKISIGKIIRLVPNHLKAKKMCKIAVKKLPSVIKYVSDQYKSNEMWNVTKENDRMLKFIPDYYEDKKCVIKQLIIILMH